MTAKDELRQALLNTCSISDEALTLLNGILDGSSGGGGGIFEVHIDDSSWSKLDATFNQIKAAAESGKIVYLIEVTKYDDVERERTHYILTQIHEDAYEGGSYDVYFGNIYYYATDPNEYPILPD